MNISFLLLKKIIELFLMIAVGYIMVKMKILKKEDSKVLSKLSLYVIMPCIFINAFQVPYTSNILIGLGIGALVAILIHIIFYLLIILLRKGLKMTEVEVASIMYSNAGNLIIPIVMSILGPEWVIFSLSYLTVQLILLWTHCKILMSGRKTIQLRDILGNINMIALAIGLILFLLRFQLPVILQNTMGNIASMIAPMSMIIAGMLIAEMPFLDMFRKPRIYLIASMRLILFPLIILLLVVMSGIIHKLPDGETILLITLLATMTPAASTIIQMAQIYDLDGHYASNINIVTTLLSIITMPLLVGIYAFLTAL